MCVLQRGTRRLGLLAFLWFGTFLVPLPGEAQFTLLEGEGKSLEIGGYLQTLTGLKDLGYEFPGADQVSGFNAEVLRLKWMLRLGDNTLLEFHDRFQTQITSDVSGLTGTAIGFGVSGVPGRSIDLSTTFVDEERFQFWHDVDRLSLTLYSGIGDLTVGRQAISWGISNLFPTSDRWTQFSPFELDTEEKPGVDALRMLSYPMAGLELDMVVADRGSADDLSAGVRASLSLSWADIYLAGGKFWNEILGMGGVSAPMGRWKLRAEGTIPYDLDQDEAKLPTVTLGVDLLGGEAMFSGEYHFNGIGATETDQYLDVLEDPRFQRGDSYYLGRHYLGGVGSWAPGNDRLSLTFSGMANLQDGSTVLTPMLTYDFGQETRVTLGGVLSSGKVPQFGDEPIINSEYGMYGDLLFTRIAIYF